MNSRDMLAEYIRTLRLDNGYSLRQLGHIKKVSAGYLSDLENCRLRLPRWETIQGIVTALDGDLNEARAHYAIWKTVSLLENTQMTKMSEREFMQVFISLFAVVFKDFNVRIAKDLIDSNGMKWDLAFDFKRMHGSPSTNE